MGKIMVERKNDGKRIERELERVAAMSNVYMGLFELKGGDR